MSVITYNSIKSEYHKCIRFGFDFTIRPLQSDQQLLRKVITIIPFRKIVSNTHSYIIFIINLLLAYPSIAGYLAAAGLKTLTETQTQYINHIRVIYNRHFLQFCI